MNPKKTSFSRHLESLTSLILKNGKLSMKEKKRLWKAIEDSIREALVVPVSTSLKGTRVKVVAGDSVGETYPLRKLPVSEQWSFSSMSMLPSSPKKLKRKSKLSNRTSPKRTSSEFDGWTNLT